MNKKVLTSISGLIVMVAEIAFGVSMLIQDIPQNVVSWILWTIMDILVTGTMFFAGSKGSWKLPAGFTVGAVFVTSILLFRGSWQWTMVETLSAVGVAVSVLVWKTAGAKVGVIASTLAMNMAGIPAMWMAFQHPDINTCWYWSVATAACIFSIVGAKSWTIEERFFPVNSLVFQAIMAVLALL